MKQWVFGLYAFLGGCSFGILSTFVKIAYGQGFTPAEVVGGQFFFGTLLLGVVVLFRKRSKIPFLMMIKLAISGVPMALSGLFYYQSLQYLDASIAIIMLFQFTWMGLIGEWIIDKRKPTGTKVFSAALLFIGSLFAVNIIGGSVLESLSLAGVIWGLLAAMSFTTFIFVSGRVGNHVPALQKSLMMAIGALLIVCIVYPPMFLVNGALQAGIWRYGLFLGLFGVFLPPLLFSISMPKIGSGLGTILTASELPTAVFMSMVVLHERVVFLQWLGVAIVLLGICVPSLLDYYVRKRLFPVRNK